MTKPVDLDALDAAQAAATAIAALHNAYPAMAAEIRALREVADAARNLTNWDWLPMLNDNESPDTDHVRGDVKKLKEALEKVPR